MRGRGNIPAAVGGLIGREREIDEVRALLRRSRMLTLTGAGGMGKSRLAIEVSRQEQAEHRDGVWIIELSSLSDEAMLTSAVAAVFGMSEESVGRLPTMLVRFLRPRTLLMVLDNCEHLIDPCASLANSLLCGAPNLRILATSREPLAIAGEYVWPIPQLQLDAAVRLFVERSEATGAADGLRHPATETVTVLCERLDRMPLAIELASARLPTLSAEEILERLDDRFRLLTGGTRTSAARHHALQATIDWSFQLLDANERLLFSRLACFPGTFSLAAAEALGSASGLGCDSVMDVLSRLVKKSLVVPEPQGASLRYRQLLAIREYGLARLREAGEEASLSRLHALYYLDLAERAESELSGPSPDVAVGKLEMEESNFEAALSWSLVNSERAVGLRLLAVLWRLWDRRGWLSLGRAWVHRFLDAGSPVMADPLLAKVALGAIVLAMRQGDLTAARDLGERWLPAVRELGDDQLLAFWLLEVGHVTIRNNETQAGRKHFEEGLDIARKLGSQRLSAACISGLGLSAIMEGNTTQARPLLEQALSIQRSVGDQGEIAGSLLGLGHTWLLDDRKRSHQYYQECLTIWRKLSVSRGIAEALHGMALVTFLSGELSRAKQHFQECLSISKDLGNSLIVADCLDGLAIMAAHKAEHALAWRTAGAADALRESTGVSCPVQTLREERLEAATVALGEPMRSSAWRAGRDADLEDIVAALFGEPQVESASTEQLSRREHEVAMLVAEGLTNRQIAQRLFVAERTAESHIEHIRNKLGFHARAQIAAWVVESRVSRQPVTPRVT